MGQRIIAFGFNDPVIRQTVPLFSKNTAVELIYWITDLVGHSYPEYDKITFIDLLEAFNARVHDEEKPFTDAALHCYLTIQPVILKMLDRVEKNGPSLDYHRRKQLFDDLFSYWWKFIDLHGITAFVCGNVPHEVTDYIIHAICRTRGILTVGFTQIGVDTVMPLSDYRELGTTEQHIVSSLSQQQQEQLAATISRRIDRYVAMSKGEKIDLFYLKKDWKDQVLEDAASRRKRRFRGKLRQLLRQPFKLSSWRYALFLAVEKPVIRKIAFRRLNTTYARRAVSQPDLQRRYVYLGLHFQPELTTSPLAEEFVDQYLIARVLLAAFPDDVYIYVKEHPNQDPGGRPGHYYDLFPSSSRIVFVPKHYSSQVLQQHCLAVASVVGTVGLEALWIGKPALVFGHAYYRRAPGTFHVTTIAQAQEAAERILAGVRIDHAELADFMRDLQSRSLPVNLSSYSANHSPLATSPRANAQLLADEVTSRLGLQAH